MSPIKGKRTARGCVVLTGRVIPGSDLLSRSCVPTPVPHLSSPLLAAQRKHDDLKEKCELGHKVTLAWGRALHSVFVSSSWSSWWLFSITSLQILHFCIIIINCVNTTGPPTYRTPEKQAMAVAAWMQGEHFSGRDFPSGAEGPFPSRVCCPLISWLLSSPELQMFVSAQTSSKGPAGRGLGAQLSVYIPSWDFAGHNQRLRSLSDGCMPAISCLFCNIPQTALSTKPESGISAEKSSKSYGFKHGKLVFNYFPFIPVNHKKGWIPCDSCRAPLREPVQV